MGGRGVVEGELGGGMVGKFIGIGYKDPVTGEVVMLPGMYKTATDAVSVGNQVSHTDAINQIQKGLSGTGKQLTKAESAQLAHQMILAGALVGKGNLRTKLYRAARMIGNYEALKGGQKSIVRRIGRILTGRITGKTFRKLFK